MSPLHKSTALTQPLFVKNKWSTVVISFLLFMVTQHKREVNTLCLKTCVTVFNPVILFTLVPGTISFINTLPTSVFINVFPGKHSSTMNTLYSLSNDFV